VLKVFKRLNFPDDRIARLQENIGVVADGLRDIDFLDGLRFDGQSVSSGSSGTTFNHKLGRTPKGWLVLSKYGLGDIYELGRTDTTLNLKSSVTVTIDIWVF
jgi:hypothetical protein